MKRTHRRNINEPGHAHLLTFSCYHGFEFLKPERTCQWLPEAINEARREFDFALWAYVFMPDHAHLIVWPRQKIYEISDIRKAIKAPVGAKGIAWLEEHAPEWLPRITRKRGSKTERLFWQSGGGHDRNVYKGRTLLDMIDYIHANPVRKGLVLRPRDWKWSSAAWFDDGTAIPLMVDHPSRVARGNLTSQAMEPRGWGRTAVTTRRARAGRSPQSAPSGTARWPHSAGGDLPGTSCL